MLLLPQGEEVETCQIWREECTYKFLCVSIKPCKCVRQLIGIKKGIKLGVLIAWQNTTPSYRQEGRHQDNHYSNYFSTEVRLSWHPTCFLAPSHNYWFTLSREIGLVFKRSRRSLLHNTSNKEDKLKAVTRIFGNPLSNPVSLSGYPLGIFIRLLPTGDGILRYCNTERFLTFRHS
jgi:hypothetical protein